MSVLWHVARIGFDMSNESELKCHDISCGGIIDTCFIQLIFFVILAVSVRIIIPSILFDNYCLCGYTTSVLSAMSGLFWGFIRWNSAGYFI